MRFLSRDAFSPENILRIGLTGSGKIFAPQATPDSMPPGPPPGICVDYWDKSCDADPLLYRYLQQTDKRGHHE
ncbi:hypothetical protein CWS43_26150 [Rahnella sp. AA]|nr:hypothetical protein CWS43_26150 [Rahnella sp. AA]